MNLSSDVLIKKLDAAQPTGTAEFDSSSVDLQGWDGVLFVGSIGTANAGNYFKAQDSADNAAWNDLAGSKTGANATEGIIDLYKPTNRYARLGVIRAGATTTVDPTIAILYRGNKKPVAQTIAKTLLATPAEGTP